MRRRTRTIVVLAVVVAALGVAIRVELTREETFLPKPLTSIEPTNAKSLEIRCSDCRTRRFERRANGWWMSEPYSLRADEAAVTRLLAVTNAPVRKKLDAGAYDLKKLGLDPPRITMKVDELTVDFGDEDPIEHDRYVRVGSDVLRVPDRFGARLLESADVEVDRHLVDPDVVVVQASVGGQPPRADLAAAWKNAIAAQTRLSENHSPASTSIVVEFADGTKAHFSMWRENEHYVVRRDAIALDYLVGEAQAQALLGKAN